MNGDPGAGLLRGSALAGFSTLLTAVGHSAGGGTVPDLAVLIILFPLLAGLCATAQHCGNLARTAAVLGAGQLAMHQFMELLHPTPHPGHPALEPGGQMIVMHATVTLVTAVALRHADCAVAGLAATLRRGLPRRLSPLPAGRPLPSLAVPCCVVPARLACAFAVAHARRGPPVRC